MNCDSKLRHFFTQILTPTRMVGINQQVKAVFALCCAWTLIAQVEPGIDVRTMDDDGRLARAKQRYYEAVEGRREALEESSAILAGLSSKRPSDPVVLAYSGSVRLLEAARALAPWKKGSLAKEGLRMLDAAVKMAPENLEVRFLRAMSSFHLPGFFKRREQSDSDFAWLAPQVEAGIASGRLDRRLGAAALYHHGLVLERSRDKQGAQAAWREAARLGTGTRAGGDAEKKLGGPAN
jgi:hypothetical protein